MPGIGLFTLTLLLQSITGTVCHMGSTIVGNIANKSIQYNDDHQLKSLTSDQNTSASSPVQYEDDHQLSTPTSDQSPSEANTSTKDLLQTIFRDVNTILTSFTTSFHDPTISRKTKRSPPDHTSQQMDPRMLKQLWDTYNRHKLQHQGAEDRYFLFPNFDSWASTFTQYFWRDMAFNVFKVVGLSALYYLAPGVLTWYTQTFGSTV